MVKMMTGNDRLPTRFLYENTFEFYPYFKMYINTNYRFSINDLTLFASDKIAQFFDEVMIPTPTARCAPPLCAMNIPRGASKMATKPRKKTPSPRL